MSDNTSVRTITDDGKNTAIETIRPVGSRMMPPDLPDETKKPRPVPYPPIFG